MAKSLVIDCGEGFLQECGQPYSPVSDWIKQAHKLSSPEGQCKKTGCTFRRFVPPHEDLRGGFLPVFWNVPRANLHPVVDVGAVVDWQF